MADRSDFFFRQLVTEGELDAALDDLEAADRSIVEDQGLSGILLGGNVIENSPTANLSVNVQGPLIAYDQTGRRMAFITAVQNVDVSVDENGISTAVTPASGDERAISVFIEFDRFLSDPRLDGNNQQVFYSRAEGFSLNVAQGAEYTPPQDPGDLPPLRADQLLLCDVTITDGMSEVLDADIDSVTRREDAFRISSGTFSSVRGILKDVLQDFANEVDLIRDEITTARFDDIRRVAATAARSTGTSAGTFDGDGNFNPVDPSNTELTLPIPVKPNGRVLTITAVVTDQGQFGGGDLTLSVIRSTGGVGVPIGSPDTSDQSGTEQTLSVAITEDTGSADNVVYIARIVGTGAVPMQVHAFGWELSQTP